MLTGGSEPPMTKRDKGQPGPEGCRSVPGWGAWGRGRRPAQGPPWNCAVWGASHPACSLPAAAGATRGCASVPVVISSREKSAVIAELLFHCCYCFLITPPSFFTSGTKLNPANLKLICGVIRRCGKLGRLLSGGRGGKARGVAGLGVTAPLHGTKPSFVTYQAPGPGRALEIQP